MPSDEGYWRTSAPLPGYQCRREWRVSDEHAAAHLAARGIRTLSTPSLLLFAEATVRICIDELLADGYTTVGVEALVKHLRAAPVGSTVSVNGVLVSIDGRRLSFHITIKSSDGSLIGEVFHERRIVSLEEFASRIRR